MSNASTLLEVFPSDPMPSLQYAGNGGAQRSGAAQSNNCRNNQQEEAIHEQYEHYVNQVLSSPYQESLFSEGAMLYPNFQQYNNEALPLVNQVSTVNQYAPQYQEEQQEQEDLNLEDKPEQQQEQQQFDDDQVLSDRDCTEPNAIIDQVDLTNQQQEFRKVKPSLGIGNSAFSRVTKAVVRTRQDEESKQEKEYFIDDQNEEGDESVFTISENIKMMLMDTGDDKTKDIQKNEPLKIKRQSSNALSQMTLRLLQSFQKCNPRFNYQPFWNPKRDLTQPSEGVLNNGYDNFDNDYILRVSDSIVTPEGKEYEILDLLGKGTFGQVVKCECKEPKEMVAIKVIKNKKAFKNQGVIEIKILDIINRVFNQNGESPLVRMLDFFVFRDHLCIVFELLSVSIYDLLKENQFNGLSLNFSRLIISHLLEAMKVVKEAKLIHCDLKPENILFKSKENLNIKVIDFGSACFEGFAIFQYIQSRYYRSPEVLLGLPYDTAIDMWSLGCICAELFLGTPIFPGGSEYDQLARIIEIIGPPSQNLIVKSRHRDKYFMLQPETMTYRFKTLEEFAYTMRTVMETPKKYSNISSLDDMKSFFYTKKKILQITQAQNQGKNIGDPNIFQPAISESELNTVDAFIDFLKGILRIDKELRWTPLMAMEHPFITREIFTGHYEPTREQERISTNETVEDSLSEQSSSSRDSKEYRVGSCPSKILYPQTASLPQYLTKESNFPQHSTQMSSGSKAFNSGGSSVQGSEYVFHGSSNQQLQSHRPPILSIPDEYFKGFMFGRLDQILSMTREQLFQFIYEQQEIAFREQQQKAQMFAQQQSVFNQQQQFQAMQQQQQIQLQQQQMFMNPQYYFGPYAPPMPIIAQQQAQFTPKNNYMGMPPPQLGGGTFIPNQNQFMGGLPAMSMPNNANMYDSPHRAFGAQPPTQFFPGPPQTNMNMGGSAFVSNYIPNQQIPGSSFHPSLMPMGQTMQPITQQFMMPPEQLIFNPPPYQQQKQQLFLNATQLNDPQYQNMLAQQQQRKNQHIKNQRGGNAFGHNNQNKGKAGSWHPPPGQHGHKYNLYYNQINNPGQIIGRNSGEQQQFIHQQYGAQQKHHHHKDKGATTSAGDIQFSAASASAPFTKNDFRSGLMDKKKSKYSHPKNTGDIIYQTVYEEASYQQSEPFCGQQQRQSDSFAQQQQQVPFPQNNSIFMNFPPDTKYHQNKKSSENLHIMPMSAQSEQMFIPQQQFFQKDIPGQPKTNNIMQQNIQQQHLDTQYQQQPQPYFNQTASGGQNSSVKPFSSPKYQANQNPGNFMLGTKKTSGGTHQKYQSQQFGSTQQQHQKSSQFLNQSQDQLNLSNSFSQTSLHSNTSGGGGFLKKFELTAAQSKQNQQNPGGGSGGGQEKKLFNQAHFYAYQKHMLGLPGQNQQNHRNRSNSDQQEELNQSNQKANNNSCIYDVSREDISIEGEEPRSPAKKGTVGNPILFSGNTIQQPPHSARGNYNFKFDNPSTATNPITNQPMFMVVPPDQNQSQVYQPISQSIAPFTPNSFKKSGSGGGGNAKSGGFGKQQQEKSHQILQQDLANLMLVDNYDDSSSMRLVNDQFQQQQQTQHSTQLLSKKISQTSATTANNRNLTPIDENRLEEQQQTLHHQQKYNSMGMVVAPGDEKQNYGGAHDNESFNSSSHDDGGGVGGCSSNYSNEDEDYN